MDNGSPGRLLLFVDHADAMGGTGFGAFAAAGAFFKIDERYVILDCNCFSGADPDTFSTGDTAAFAYRYRVLAHACVAAQHNGLRLAVNAINQVARACGNARAAVGTGVHIDTGDTVNDPDSIKFTGSNAIPQPNTTIGALNISAIEHGCGLTRLYAIVLKILSGNVIGTMAFIDGKPGVCGHARDAEQIGDCLHGFLTAGIAFIDRRAVFNDIVRIVLAACKTAAATVCAGQYVLDLFDPRVRLHVHDDGSYR